VRIVGTPQFTQNAAELPGVDPMSGDIEEAWAPPFTLENQVCVADHSKYVKRNAFGEITSEYTPEEVTHAPDGTFYVHGKPALRETVHARERVVPVRAECRHYVRQLDPPSPNLRSQGYTRGSMNRYCSARRNTAGAFFRLKDGEMGACSMRDPYDQESATKLAEFDALLLKKSSERTYLSMFDLESERLFGKGEAANKKETK